MQVDYASAALFLNISMHVAGTSESQVAWWQHPELRMKAGLDPRTQVAHLSLPPRHGTKHLAKALPCQSGRDSLQVFKDLPLVTHA